MKTRFARCAILVLPLAAALLLNAQDTASPNRPPPGGDNSPPGERGGPGGRGGFGGPRGGVKEDRKLVAQFDQDGDKMLNTIERKAAREFLAKERMEGRGNDRGPRGRGPRGNDAAARPGPRVSPAEVPAHGDSPLYASNIVRTLFLDFTEADWEKELAEFHGTDVEVPATLTVDGKRYSDVGVHFRGASSFMMVGEGSKRSLNLSLDFMHDDQRLLGHRTLNLLNSNDDPSFLHTVLFSHVARNYIPAPRANHVRVVINGESWGLYVNAEQFNKDFTKAAFGSTKGAHWKVPGSPRGQGV